MHIAREIYSFIITNGKLLSLLLTLGQKTVLAGAVAVEGAGLENRRTGVLSHIAGSNFAYSVKTIRNGVWLSYFWLKLKYTF